MFEAKAKMLISRPRMKPNLTSRPRPEAVKAEANIARPRVKFESLTSPLFICQIARLE